MKLIFKPITEFKPGIILDLLSKSYEALTKQGPKYSKLIKKWAEDDKDAYENLDTIGKCFFITCLNYTPIGLGSYDPRQGPELGIIGENCILPRYRGHGYGKKQIQEILRRFREMKFKKARVSTSEHPFFISAQKNYQSVGFLETRRFKDSRDSEYKMIEYETTL